MVTEYKTEDKNIEGEKEARISRLDTSLEVSIIIPCYNEEKRLEPGISEATDFFYSRLGRHFELVFVNDGSTDQTGEVLKKWRNKYSYIPIEIIEYSPNRGKGYAVKTGMLAARGRKLITSDADFSIDLEEIFRFVEKLDEYEIVIGTKKHEETQSLKKQSVMRQFLGRGFTKLTNFLLGINFSDITCGLKGFRQEVARELFSRQHLERWSYDAEILYLASRRQYNILEVPVRWKHVEGSKVIPLLDTIRSLKELLAIIFYHRRRS